VRVGVVRISLADDTGWIGAWIPWERVCGSEYDDALFGVEEKEGREAGEAGEAGDGSKAEEHEAEGRDTEGVRPQEG